MTPPPSDHSGIQVTVTRVHRDSPDGPDSPDGRDIRDSRDSAAGGLIAEYLHRTEQEKHRHGVTAHPPPPHPGLDLPETLDPSGAYAGGAVFLAHLDAEPVGVVAVTTRCPATRTVEIKRLWVRPEHRGSGVGSALLRAAIRAATRPDPDGSHPDEIRLTVWRWRRAAIALYRREGFTVAESWEPDRPDLVCMRLEPTRPGVTGS